MADITNIKPELQLAAATAPALDKSLLVLSKLETAFLHNVIDQDDDEMHERIFATQTRAYTHFAYPCIRHFHFLTLFMRENAAYQKVLASGRANDTVFLEIGCCMGTDVRKLAADGYSATNIFACDLRQEFIDCGHDLYQDAATCKIHFFTSDIFEMPVTAPATSRDLGAVDGRGVTRLEQLAGRITHLYIGAVFHLFDEHTQYVLATRIAGLVKHAAGTIIFGRHEGCKEAGMIENPQFPGRYGHSPTSWAALWRRVFSEVESPQFAESRVSVTADIIDNWGRDEIVVPSTSSQHLFWSVEIV